ncbi:GNAT family N-acetyltransferase [Corynebacterium lizhenjunii]|uniref:GNAT family N-acetyltransferase n=1 Tax=Corynebacterium lizhenjunii TaxID=2709394 RepID=UPI0013EDA30C|nr:GNAT family N-acetyltransferase [Corynebacterium lizhenjunii]
MLIRPAQLADAPAITQIYNWASAQPALNLVTWQESAADRETWLREQNQAGYPVFVAEEDGQVLGWAAYFQFVTPAIYYGTVENSVYVDPQAHGKGVGSQLMEAVLEHAEANDYVRTMITYIVDENYGSLALHLKFGFVETGRMPNIHTKAGKRLGLVHLQRDFTRD